MANKRQNSLGVQPLSSRGLKQSNVAAKKEGISIKKRSVSCKNEESVKRSRPGVISLHTVKEIEEQIPYVKIFRNFLPEEESAKVLESLMERKWMFQEKEFYIAGKLCKSSQRSSMFVTPGFEDLDSLYSSNDMKNMHFFPELESAKKFVDKRVNEILANRERHPLEIQTDWETNMCVGNLFENNASHLDWHSDKLTNTGPLPTIASLSFGATRMFRLRRIEPNSAIYNIILPNNTLLVMLPGCQELFKHSVPTLANSLVSRNKLSGDARFSLTFRMVEPTLYANPVHCDKCNERMILRRISNNGYYMWMCYSSFKGGKCRRRRHSKLERLNETGGNDLTTDSKTEGTKWFP